MTSLFDDPRVADLVGPGVGRMIADAFASVEVAEEEIAAARGSTGVDRDDPLWRAFPLLRPTHDRMTTEFVYRAHCRELLARIRDGRDTRPATDAEIAANVGDASLAMPLDGDLVALQMRIFARAFPDEFARLDLDPAAHESVHGPGADEWDRRLRHRLRQDWRRE